MSINNDKSLLRLQKHNVLFSLIVFHCLENKLLLTETVINQLFEWPGEGGGGVKSKWLPLFVHKLCV